jgi:cytoskeletal protein CcmA (bactofilin family)
VDEIDKTESVTRIAKGTRIKADIETDADIHISGTVEGNVSTKNRISISETGKLTGSLEAKEARISGKFTGELRVLNHISLSNTADVDGFIFSKTITVDENASLIGILNVGKDVDVLNAKIEGQKKTDPVRKSENSESVETQSEDESVEKEELKPSPPKNRFIAELLIGIPDDISDDLATKVFKQAENIIKSLGYELEIFDHPKLNPYYHHLTYVKKSNENQDAVSEKFSNVKDIIESSFLKKSEEEAESDLQKSAINLTNVIGEIDNIAIQIARILILKFKNGEVQTIAVEETSEKITTALKKDPRKITEPETLYALL